MPQTFGLEHLVEYMLTIGPGLSGAMGMIALDFKEIDAWDKLDMLSTSDRCIIRDLSRAYVGQSNISGKFDCPAPWVKGVDDIEAYNMIKGMTNISDQTKGSRPLSSRKTRPRQR